MLYRWCSRTTATAVRSCLRQLQAVRMMSSMEAFENADHRNFLESTEHSWLEPSTSKERHDVLVIHPKVRWGSGSASKLQDPKRQLDEAVALVNTLPKFRVVDSVIVGTDYNTKRKLIWGSGQLENLAEKKQQMMVSALMINVDMLSPLQQSELSRQFGVPVFDRYNIVLSIFRHYANSELSRLQILLAEIPYIRHRLSFVNNDRHSRGSIEPFHITDQLHALTHAKGDPYEILRMREQFLRKKIKEASERQTTVSSGDRNNCSSVAVVGYTNAGKTSLVKRLTGSDSLKPEDRLFATLDTTDHLARLPSGRQVALCDTIGFLSDLPMHLIEAFHATLAHVKHADVIVHIRDVSNPDWPAQSENVLETLDEIGVSPKKMSRIITIDNKIDKPGSETTSDVADVIRVSCETGDGMDTFIKTVDLEVQRVSGCVKRRFVLPASSPVITYLYRNNFVQVEPLVKDDRLVFDVVMSESEFAQMNKRVKLRKTTA